MNTILILIYLFLYINSFVLIEICSFSPSLFFLFYTIPNINIIYILIFIYIHFYINVDSNIILHRFLLKKDLHRINKIDIV